MESEEMELENMRLQKYMALCGVSSRRTAEMIIRSGRVTVNGQVVTTMGMTVDGTQTVAVDGLEIAPEEHKVYILLHKPEGYVCTVKDPEGRPTVMSLLGGLKERVYPVGRLDYDSSGLLMLTNDGELAHRLTHPRHEVSKCYIALVEGIPSGHILNELRRGVMLDGRRTAPAEVICTPVGSNASEIEMTIHEGRNRQIRRMCEAIGHPVRALRRIAIGSLSLDDLPEGQWRTASKEDLDKMTGES
jgi:23S rRNA pseudouridine2605 synthase